MEKILANLTSAYSQLQAKTAETIKEREAINARNKKFDERETKQKEKTTELIKREADVKHIESIDDSIKQAKDLQAEVVKASNELTAAQENYSSDVKKFKVEREAIYKEAVANRGANKAQAEALKTERKAFEEEKRLYKLTILEEVKKG